MFGVFSISKAWMPKDAANKVCSLALSSSSSLNRIPKIYEVTDELIEKFNDSQKEFYAKHPNYVIVSSNDDSLENSWYGEFKIIYKKSTIFELFSNAYDITGSGVQITLIEDIGNLGADEYKEIEHIRRDINNMNYDLQEKIDGLMNNIDCFDGNRVGENYKVTGNINLTQIEEVTYREDFCSDALQEMIDDGWILMAVCPQTNQRRPDYVLGRLNKKR